MSPTSYQLLHPAPKCTNDLKAWGPGVKGSRLKVLAQGLKFLGSGLLPGFPAAALSGGNELIDRLTRFHEAQVLPGDSFDVGKIAPEGLYLVLENAVFLVEASHIAPQFAYSALIDDYGQQAVPPENRGAQENGADPPHQPVKVAVRFIVAGILSRTRQGSVALRPGRGGFFILQQAA